MIAVLDYGMGNLRSVEKALEHVGAAVEITYAPERVRAAEALVLPGVGAFPKAIEAIRERGLDELVHERRSAGVPILGICLGMQLLFDSSVELGGADGLRLLPGEVRALDAPGLKIPQIGWNTVSWQQQSPLVEGLGEAAAFYHVHSFAPTAPNGVVLGTAEYGSEFVSAVARDGVYGVQFHPEKSGPDGLSLLGNFVKLAE
ncbi:MAG TPA: imidazole glycerol phosphate synthase subunit HisH [Thermoleophilaceae bacterium]|nr:imidazole glycerol phosphate synthase subunit HisH [Thermoleophilaceae bacterium]